MKKIFVSLIIFIFCFSLVGTSLAYDEPKNTDPDKYYILLDIKNQICTVFEKDDAGEYTKIVRRFLVSTGSYAKSAKYPYGTPTPLGTWKLGGGRERFGEFAGFDNTYARYWTQIVSGIFFHSIMYTKRDLETLQSSAYRNLGNNVSHGCIRLMVEDAKWLYYYACPGTTIKITEGEPRDNELKKKLRSQLSFEDYDALQKGIYDDAEGENPKAWVTYKNAPLRTGNGNNDRVIKSLNPDDEVEMLHIGDPWCKVKIDGKEGYILTSYLTYEKGVIPAHDEATTAKRHTWMYTSADTKSDKIVMVPAFTSVKVLSGDDKYLQVEYLDEVGYVLAKEFRKGWGLIRE